MNTEQVNELIASLESAGELSIREEKFLKLAKAFKQMAADNEKAMHSLQQADAAVKLAHEKFLAITAENVAMIRLLTDISENHVEYFSEGEDGMFAGVPLDYVSEINMYVSRDVNAENPFPATDRIVAGIKADGAEACVRALVTSDDDDFTDAPNICAEVARLLREGADK